jgi:hypothetical protein
MAKPIHLALRYNPSGNVDLLGFKPDLSKSTIQHHIDVVKSNNYVWWGKMGKEGFGNEKLDQLRDQISKGVKTYAYLFELSSISYKAEILQLTQDIDDVEVDKIPDYYKNVAADLCELFLKLTNFEEQDRVDAITTLTLANKPDSLGGFHNALRGQSSRFYVVEGDTSLKKVFEYANTYKKSSSPKTRTQLVESLVTDHQLVKWIKNLYNNICQICSTVISVPKGRYSEAAHIKAKKDGGLDDQGNILCLCANCHSKFDLGGIYINDNYEVFDLNNKFLSKLTIAENHIIDKENLKYHRIKFFPEIY